MRKTFLLIAFTIIFLSSCSEIQISENAEKLSVNVSESFLNETKKNLEDKIRETIEENETIFEMNITLENETNLTINDSEENWSEYFVEFELISNNETGDNSSDASDEDQTNETEEEIDYDAITITIEMGENHTSYTEVSYEFSGYKHVWGDELILVRNKTNEVILTDDKTRYLGEWEQKTINPTKRNIAAPTDHGDNYYAIAFKIEGRNEYILSNNINIKLPDEIIPTGKAYCDDFICFEEAIGHNREATITLENMKEWAGIENTTNRSYLFSPINDTDSYFFEHILHSISYEATQELIDETRITNTSLENLSDSELNDLLIANLNTSATYTFSCTFTDIDYFKMKLPLWPSRSFFTQDLTSFGDCEMEWDYEANQNTNSTS